MYYGVRESVNKSAASAASLDYVKFQAVIKSAARAASLRGGRASGRLDHGCFCMFLAKKIVKISDSVFMWSCVCASSCLVGADPQGASKYSDGSKAF